MESKVLIRYACIEDAQGIFVAHKRSVYEICSQDYNSEEIQGWFPASRTAERYATAISENEKSYLVATVDNVIAGFSSFAIDDKKQCHVSGLYVHPTYCGNGVGKELFNRVEELAIQAECLSIHLNSSITAHLFYEKVGMTTIKFFRHKLGSGTELNAFQMKKDLLL